MSAYKTFRYFVTCILVVLTLIIIYSFSFLIAKGLGIQDQIIPSLVMTLPDMRGDIKVFTALLSIMFFVSSYIYMKYDEKKKIQEQEEQQKNKKTYKEYLEIQKIEYEKRFDCMYTPENKLNVESKRIGKLLIEQNNKGKIKLSVTEAIYSNISPEFKTDDEKINILIRVVDYFTFMHYDILATDHLQLEYWD